MAWKLVLYVDFGLVDHQAQPYPYYPTVIDGYKEENYLDNENLKAGCRRSCNQDYHLVTII